MVNNATEYAVRRLQDDGDEEGPHRPSELAEEYGCSRSHMNHVLGELVKKGIAERVGHGEYVSPRGEEAEDSATDTEEDTDTGGYTAALSAPSDDRDDRADVDDQEEVDDQEAKPELDESEQAEVPKEVEDDRDVVDVDVEEESPVAGPAAIGATTGAALLPSLLGDDEGSLSAETVLVGLVAVVVAVWLYYHLTAPVPGNESSEPASDDGDGGAPASSSQEVQAGLIG